jgi:hypothetical protein
MPAPSSAKRASGCYEGLDPKKLLAMLIAYDEGNIENHIGTWRCTRCERRLRKGNRIDDEVQLLGSWRSPPPLDKSGQKSQSMVSALEGRGAPSAPRSGSAPPIAIMSTGITTADMTSDELPTTIQAHLPASAGSAPSGPVPTSHVNLERDSLIISSVEPRVSGTQNVPLQRLTNGPSVHHALDSYTSNISRRTPHLDLLALQKPVPRTTQSNLQEQANQLFGEAAGSITNVATDNNDRHQD